MRKTISFIAVMLVAFCMNARETDTDKGPASVLMPFSLIPRNAEALSMGGTSAARDAASSFNPCTLEVNAGYQMWAPSLVTGSNNVVFDAAGKLSDKVGVVFAIASDIGKSYILSSDSDALFKPKDLSLKLGASFKVSDFLAFGADVKYFNSTLSKMDRISSPAAGFYAAANFSGLTTSVGVSNLGRSEGFSLPSSVFLTAAYASGMGETVSLRAALQTDWFFYNAVSAGAGIELGVKDMVFLRTGYHYASEKAVLPSFFSAGAGVKFRGAKLNAAYLLASEALGNTLQVSLGYEF